MIFKSKSATRSMKVVEHQPWRRPLMFALTGIIGVVCLLLGYTLGQNSVLSSKVSGENVSRHLLAAQARLQELEAELVDARLNEEVLRQAGNALRDDLTLAHEKSARLQEEVTFYKGLMAPSSLPQGLQVAELDLSAIPDSQDYDFELLLTQVALRRSFIAGEVRLDIIGTYEGTQERGEAVLSLTELAQLKSYPLKFRFRYFQDLTGRITLPEGFMPQRVLVTANQSGKDPLQVTFPWPQL